MFQVIYKCFKCRQELVQSTFTHKEFCMQKNRVEAFICCCFFVMSEKNECAINGKSITIKIFLFQTHLKPEQKGQGMFTLAHKVKNCLFSSSKSCIHCSRPFPYPSKLSLSQEFCNKSLFETVLV